MLPKHWCVAFIVPLFIQFFTPAGNSSHSNVIYAGHSKTYCLRKPVWWTLDSLVLESTTHYILIKNFGSVALCNLDPLLFVNYCYVYLSSLSYTSDEPNLPKWHLLLLTSCDLGSPQVLYNVLWLIIVSNKLLASRCLLNSAFVRDNFFLINMGWLLINREVFQAKIYCEEILSAFLTGQCKERLNMCLHGWNKLFVQLVIYVYRLHFFTTKVGFEIMMIAILGCDSCDFVVSCHFMDSIENN